MGRVLMFLFAGMTPRMWAIIVIAGVTSFGSFSYFVRDPLPSMAESLPPARIKRIEMPVETPYVPRRVTEVHDLPDITFDSLKAGGISEDEILKALDKLIDDPSQKGQPILSAGKLPPSETTQPTTPVSAP